MTYPATFVQPSLCDRFALIIGGLRQALAAHGGRHRAAGPPLGLLLILIYNRLGRMAKRWAVLAARAQAGPLPPPRLRAAAPRPPREPQRTLPHRPLPQGFAWLIKLVPETVCFGEHLQHLLSDPELQALLRAAPQLGRLLRPLCRALAIRPDPALLPPPPPHRARPAAPPETQGQAPPDRPVVGPHPDPPKPPARVYGWRSWRGVQMPVLLRPKPA